MLTTPRLWIREPSGAVREQPLEERGPDGMVIGRDKTADLPLNDPAVSRQHAKLLPTPEGGWKLVDLGSANRTFVNGEPILEVVLAPGDRIGIGDCELRLIGEVARDLHVDARTQVLTRMTDPSAVRNRSVALDPSAAADPARASAVLSLLYKLTRELAAPESSDSLLERALKMVTQELDADRGAALLLEGDALLCRAAHARGGQALRGFVLSQTIYHEVMQSREAVLSRDTSLDQRFRRQESIVGEEIRSIIAAPLRAGDRIRGILYLDRLEGPAAAFQVEELYGAAVAAEMIAMALESRSALRGLEKERENLVRTLIDAHPIVGTSKPIQRVRDFIRRAAPTPSTVLILGETGTGKELVARAIHYQSSRRGEPFIAINCAAIPETLIESELFGYEKGAFTGAGERKPGKFEAADHGTVFLDEIAELPLQCQAKLLRLLEERCFERVGGTKTVPVDVRIVAATNRDLALEAEQGRFRKDLYYRLDVLQLMLPPLRERREDIPVLIEHFLDEFGASAGGQRKKLSEEARRLLVSHDWPGNVRQLRNMIESGMVLSADEMIQVQDLPLRGAIGAAAPAEEPAAWAPRSLADVEAEHIGRMLEHAHWNKSKAAELLGIERSTLYARIKTHALKPKE